MYNVWLEMHLKQRYYCQSGLLLIYLNLLKVKMYNVWLEMHLKQRYQFQSGSKLIYLNLLKQQCIIYGQEMHLNQRYQYKHGYIYIYIINIYIYYIYPNIYSTDEFITNIVYAGNASVIEVLVLQQLNSYYISVR